MVPLFDCFPGLERSIPFLPLGTLPTPVAPLAGLCRALGRPSLYIKRDDLSGDLYGGNKVRKLEFLLADAKRRNASRIITSGAAGSNHALATALYGRRCGFATTLMLFEQPPGQGIGATLLADFAAGAQMFHDTTFARHLDHLHAMAVRYEHTEGSPPYVIPGGGSNAVGAIGFVNAAFELREQIARGLIPEPAAIYVAFGTMGTAAGLLLGLKAARIRSRLIAVRVVPHVVANSDKFGTLFEATNRLLNDCDPSFPRISFNDRELAVYDDFLGEGYGIATPASLSAIDYFKPADDISLDPVYTGKTGAAFIADARTQALHDKPLLFWHTKSRHVPPLRDLPGGDDFRRLPGDFHRYFTTDAAITGRQSGT